MSPLLSPMSPVGSGGGNPFVASALGSGVQHSLTSTTTANSSPATPAANIDLTKYMPMTKSSSFGHNKSVQSPLTARNPAMMGGMQPSALSNPPQSSQYADTEDDDDIAPPPPPPPAISTSSPRRASASATVSPGGTRRPSQQAQPPHASSVPAPASTGAIRRASSPHAGPPLAISTNPTVQRVAVGANTNDAAQSPTIIMDPIAKVSNLRSKFDQPAGTAIKPTGYHPASAPRSYAYQQHQHQNPVKASHITTTTVTAPTPYRVPLETHAVDSDDDGDDEGRDLGHANDDEEDDPTFGGLGSGKVRSLKSLFESGGVATSLSNLHSVSPASAGQHDAVASKYFAPDSQHAVDTDVDTEVDDDDDDIPPPPPPPRSHQQQQPTTVEANKRVSFSATNSVQQVSSVSLMSESENSSPKAAALSLLTEPPRRASGSGPGSATARAASAALPPSSPTAAAHPSDLSHIYETIVQEANVVLSRKSSRVDPGQLAQAAGSSASQQQPLAQTRAAAPLALAPLQVPSAQLQATATAESMLLSRQQSLTELFRLLDLPLDSTTPGGPLAPGGDSSTLTSPHKTSSRNGSQRGTLTRQIELAKASAGAAAPTGAWTPSVGEGVSPGSGQAAGASPSQVISDAYQWLNSQRTAEVNVGPVPQLPHPDLVSPIVPPPPPQARGGPTGQSQRPVSTTSSMFAQRATQVLEMEWGDEVSMLADLLYGTGDGEDAGAATKLPEVELAVDHRPRPQPPRMAVDTTPAPPRSAAVQTSPPKSPVTVSSSSNSTVNRDRALTDAPPPVAASFVNTTGTGLPNSQSVPNALTSRGAPLQPQNAQQLPASAANGATRLSATEMAERLRQAEERRAAQRAAAAVSLSNSHPTHAPAPNQRSAAHGLDAADPRVAEALAKLAAAQVQKMPIRVYINDMAVFKTVEITSVMAAGVVAEAVAERAVLAGMVPNSPNAPGGGTGSSSNNNSSGGGWTLFEVFADVGIERPLRDWERVTDVMRSWERDTKNAFLLRRYGYKSSLTVDALKMFYPGVKDYLHIETKPGTFKRKYFELRLGIEQNYTGATGQGALNPKSALVEREVAGLYMSNAEDKQAVLLCSLAHYDVYTPINGPRKRAPTKYGFALKSQQRMSLFEDPNDGFVFYLYTYSMEKMKEWVLALRNAKAHVDRVLRPEWLSPFEELQMQQQQQLATSTSTSSTAPRPTVPSVATVMYATAEPSVEESNMPPPQQQQQSSIYQTVNSNVAIAAHQAQPQHGSPPRQQQQQQQQQPALPRGVVASNSSEYRAPQQAPTADFAAQSSGASRPPPAAAMGTSAAASYPNSSATYNISSSSTAAQRPLPNPPAAIVPAAVATGGSNSIPRSTSSSLRDPPFPTSSSNKSSSLTRPVAPGETYMDRIETQRVQLATAVAQAKKAPGSNGPLVDIIPEGHGRR
ncbi:hypothetical protein BCR44DRAFT_80298 [Catenaria anguillulae PL171]|uniref:Ras-associating domain-containing protein n=1 Tax=Catenaria anguillulae PL171 TaxID=765915 RepID=A0A1Y2HN95_9FUNG|nr:hypothetical protein BCR44DRAFT_80298 [Catenaria anguillulae PL171]